jgi:hypothetical protein
MGRDKSVSAGEPNSERMELTKVEERFWGDEGKWTVLPNPCLGVPNAFDRDFSGLPLITTQKPSDVGL